MFSVGNLQLYVGQLQLSFPTTFLTHDAAVLNKFVRVAR